MVSGKIGSRWLRVSPKHGVILVGKSQEISFTVTVDEKAAQKAFRQPDYLQSLLTLNITSGSHYFIEIETLYKQSCFGATVQGLVKCP
jgi:hypothetical protein